jgi:hypothetical protein
MTWQERHGEQWDRPDFSHLWTVKTVGGVRNALHVTVPAGQLNGCDKRWKPPEMGTHDEIMLRYRVWFPPGFPFENTGKLAGIGGKANGSVFDLAWGGNHPGDSWTARLVYGPGGRCGVYFYAESPRFANGFGYPVFAPDPDAHLREGWNDYELHVRMNTPGVADGFASVRVNKVFGVHVPNIEWRSADHPTLGANVVLCYGGFGGGPEMAPAADTSFAFANFRLLVPT